MRRGHISNRGLRDLARGGAAGALGLVVATTALVLLVTFARHGLSGPAGRAGPTRADEVLLVLLAWVGVLLAAWLALGTLLAVAALLPGAGGRAAAEVADRVTPVAARKMLTLVLGASVGTLALPAAPASSAGQSPVGLAAEGVPRPQNLPGPDSPHDRAEPPGPFADGTPVSAPGYRPDSPAAASAAVTPGFVPTADTTPAPPAPAPSPGFVPTAPTPVHDADRTRLLVPPPRSTTAANDLVTIRRGDTLWAIAARHLGPGAPVAQIASEWPRWYAANRDVIGNDPDLLLPGQQLVPPSAGWDTDPRTLPSPPSSTVSGAASSSVSAPEGAVR